MNVPSTYKSSTLLRTIGKYSEEVDLNSAFELTTTTLRIPTFHQLLIKVSRCQINPSDTSYCQNRYGITCTPPVVPGFEGCGRVVAAGWNPLAYRLIGKKMAFYCEHSWAEYVLVDFHRCIELNESTKWENAAGAIVNPSTVMEMLNIAAGHDCVVVTAGASSLSKQFMKIAKSNGIKTIAVVRKQEQLVGCEAAGAALALDSNDPEFGIKLTKACEENNCKLGFDSVCGDTGSQVLKSLRKDGVLHVYGFLSGKPVSVAGADVIFKNKKVVGLSLGDALKKMSVFQVYQMQRAIANALDGDLSTEVHAEFPLSRVGDALKAYTQNLSQGKVHIICDPDLV